MLMTKILIVLSLLLMVCPVFGQDIDPGRIDLSQARMSIAGPEEIYVTNVYYDNTRLSVLLAYDGKSGATIYGPWYDSDKLLQDYFELGYASLRIQDDTTLIVSDVMLGTRGFSGRFKFDGNSKLALDGAWATMTPHTAEMKVANIEAQLLIVQKRYEQQLRAADTVHSMAVAELQTELSAARRAAIAAGADADAITAGIAPSDVQQVGFTGGRSLSGDWSVSSAGAAQIDSEQYFAKLVIPFNQVAKRTLYSFEARSTGSGFTGYGVHFFASPETRRNGYGYGASYLVWLTRDPAHFGTDATYLQLYRSYNDVTMVQIASIQIKDSIDRLITTDVLYDQTARTIGVTANGVEYLNVSVSSPISSGREIALRALGDGVLFNDLTVSAR
jgi:hypothetical protein